MLFSAASSWRTTSELPAWRRKRSPTHASNPSNAFGRTGGGGLRQAPSVATAAPSFGGARAPPHSGGLTNPATSASAWPKNHRLLHLIVCKPSVCGSVSVVEMVIQTSPSDHERGWFLMSPAGRFVVSPDMEGASRGSAASDTKPADRHLITASRSGRPRPSRSSMRSRPGCTPNCPISWASRRWPPRSATR